MVFGVLFFGALVLVVAVALPLWKPMLIAAVLASTVSRWNERLTHRLGGRRALAAGLSTAAVLLLVLMPLITIVATIAGQAASAAREAFEVFRVALSARGGQGLLRLARFLPDSVEGFAVRALAALRQAGFEVQGAPGAADTGRWAAAGVASALSMVSNVSFHFVMMLIAFYCLLCDGYRLVNWAVSVLPIPGRDTREVIDEFKATSRNLIASTVVTGLVQAGVATVGYVVAGVPKAWFFGVVTFIASAVPSVGTGLISVPVCALLALMGRPVAALLLLAWSLMVVGTLDNALRPMLLKGEMHLHGGLVFFSFIGGIMVFGAVGLLVGPLALAMFMTLLRIGQRDFAMKGNDAKPATLPPPPPPEGGGDASG